MGAWVQEMVMANIGFAFMPDIPSYIPRAFGGRHHLVSSPFAAKDTFRRSVGLYPHIFWG